ncbi:hypothetical protein D3C73_1278540 [compost metagenome]
MRPSDVAGPDVGRQPVLDVIGQRQAFGFVLERDQAGDRSEDFFLRAAHAVIHVGQHGRPHEIAARQVGRQAHRLARAARKDTRPFLFGKLDVAGDLFPMLARDHRAHVRGFVGGVAHYQALRALGEFAHEIIVDALLDKNA